MSRHLFLAATALSLTLSPLAASAHHRSGHDGGGGRAAAEERRGGEDRGVGRGAENRAEESRGDHPCGWGLADRDVPCVPPGLAAKGVTTDDWIGAPTPVDSTTDLSTLSLIEDTRHFPALEEGQEYAVLGDAVIVVQAQDGVDADGLPVTTYSYVSTYGRLAFPGQ